MRFRTPASTEQERPPSGADWVHEIKWDDYRAQAHLSGGKARIYTPRGLDWTRQFRPIVDALVRLQAKRLIIDGEVASPGESGRADFHALRAELGRPSGKMRFHAFDLLVLNGADLRLRSLVERKATPVFR